MKQIKVEKTASRGIAIGKVHIYEEATFIPSEESISESDIPGELEKFKLAREQVCSRLELLAQENEIFGAHLMMAQDYTLESSVVERIQECRINAQLALSQVTGELREQFKEMENEYMRERASDIQDIEHQYLAAMQGRFKDADADWGKIEAPVILAAADLLPSDTAKLDPRQLLGMLTQEGGITSHVSIMAKGWGIPALVGVKTLMDNITEGDLICMDAGRGELVISPTEEVLQNFRARKREAEEKERQLEELKDLPARTLDGHRVTLCANVGNAEDVAAAMLHQAEGVGLFRSEFLYMENTHFPTEEEQFEVYKTAVCNSPAELTIRTLDIGGDKALKYFDFGEEENPFLGWRAIRISLDLTDIFKTQLRAILRAGAYGKIRVMFPMIVSVEEFRQAKSLLSECAQELDRQGIPYDSGMKAGMMIETPASVMMAGELAEVADFFSIGTNDLTQYLLAVDRGNPKISEMYNSYHPAVLRAVWHVIQSGHARQIKVGMCGEFASDPRAIPLLVGMGLDEFSMSPADIPQSKAVIRGLSYQKMNQAVGEILRCSTIGQVMEALP
ncbi:phosphoenolpyruvate--protein phosphotransferase [Faecalicatena orotica]|uniref:phosphoenolpyruvate--protein phosphotransferase n=1 Tax=Faecalicatena orotica TaxID=1544 RepID=UPI003216C111